MNINLISVVRVVLIYAFLLIPSSFIQAQDVIKVGDVTNEIRMGKFAGNRDLSLGVKNILEELLLDLDYDLSDTADKQVNIRLVFFDIVNIGKSIGVYHNKVSATQIIAIGELVVNGKVKKRTTQKGVSKEISNSTLVIASDGTFNQQTASGALKKVCEAIINDLLK